MIELIFETHAMSVDNEDGLASGHWDARLSPLARNRRLNCDVGIRRAQIWTSFALTYSAPI